MHRLIPGRPLSQISPQHQPASNQHNVPTLTPLTHTNLDPHSLATSATAIPPYTPTPPIPFKPPLKILSSTSASRTATLPHFLQNPLHKPPPHPLPTTLPPSLPSLSLSPHNPLSFFSSIPPNLLLTSLLTAPSTKLPNPHNRPKTPIDCGGKTRTVYLSIHPTIHPSFSFIYLCIYFLSLPPSFLTPPSQKHNHKHSQTNQPTNKTTNRQTDRQEIIVLDHGRKRRRVDTLIIYISGTGSGYSRVEHTS